MTVYNLLGAFTKVRKGLLASSCTSVRMEQLGFRWTDFHEILHLSMCIFECVDVCMLSLVALHACFDLCMCSSEIFECIYFVCVGMYLC
jgi:hypothetical protein